MTASERDAVAPEGAAADAPAGPTPPGLYVHVPFCARACPYCDFDFEVGRTAPTAAFLDALEQERRGRAIAPGQPVHTVYLGGGTPSLLGPPGLTALLGWIDACFDTSATVERTVELNPEHVDAALLEALVGAGVDRVSLGVQSLGRSALVQLGRVHDGARARQALRAAVDRGLRVSADLIVGWPGQTAASLDDDLQGVLEAGVEHVSIYALTIEAGTPWERQAQRGRRALPDADGQAERLQQAEARLEAAGLRHYEVASYARPGAEARHNSLYWRWHDVIALGPSAASARYEPSGAVQRRTNQRGYGRWVVQPDAGAEHERLDPVSAAAEGLWTGLRRLDGISVAAFLRRFPAVDAAWLRRRLARPVALGNVEATPDGTLRVAPGRWLWHDEIGVDVLDPPDPDGDPDGDPEADPAAGQPDPE